MRATKDLARKEIFIGACDDVPNTSSFYYSPTGDITTSLQRQNDSKIKTPNSDNYPIWWRADERFFWNRYMLPDVILSWNVNADSWIIPIIQGFVQVEYCTLDMAADVPDSNIGKDFKKFDMILISRRIRFRAGTVYKRQGVDEQGKVANYVETEQIFTCCQHAASFVQVRGSVPVYWSQPGSKYRPPPRIDRPEDDTASAFKKHFEEEP